MSQEDLAEKVDTTASVISMLEAGERGLSAKWLRRLAPALDTTPCHLLEHDPSDLPTDILDIWAHISTRDKATALRILRSRLAEVEEEKREAELARERGAAQDIGFGSQIRSYVLHPYQLVKDHRTDFEVGNIQSVLDGGLDGFVRAYLLAKAAGQVV